MWPVVSIIVVSAGGGVDVEVDGVSVGAGAIAELSVVVLVSSVLPPQAVNARPVARSAVNKNARIFMRY